MDTVQPGNRAAMPPGQPCVADRLSITIAVIGSRMAAAYAIASWFEPSSSSASPSSTTVRVSR